MQSPAPNQDVPVNQPPLPRSSKTSLLRSYKRLFEPRTLAICGVMLALCVVLGRFSVYLTESIKISFAFLPIAIVGMLFGPYAGLLIGALNDILGYLIAPMGAYFPGYTITSALTGLVFGLWLYEQAPTFWRLLFSRATIVVLLHIGLNTLWTSILYGNAFFVLLPARALKSAIQFPVDVLLLYLVLGVLIDRAGKAIQMKK